MNYDLGPESNEKPVGLTQHLSRTSLTYSNGSPRHKDYSLRHTYESLGSFKPNTLVLIGCSAQPRCTRYDFGEVSEPKSGVKYVSGVCIFSTLHRLATTHSCGKYTDIPNPPLKGTVSVENPFSGLRIYSRNSLYKGFAILKLSAMTTAPRLSLG
jgi:hypothetical protein